MTGHVDRLLERHFAGELGHEERASMRDHLRRCARCREEHDDLATLLRTAAAEDAGPTAAEMARWQQDLEIRLGWAAPPPAPAPSRSPAWFLVPLAAACALALVSGALLLFISADDTSPQQQLRGGRAVTPLVGLELSAVSQTPGATPTARRLADGDAASLDEYLQLRYRVHGAGLGHLYLLGLDARSRLLDYYPRPSARASIQIQEALSPRSVGRSIRLAKRHQPGPLWVVALFSPAPLERQAVHARLRDLMARGINPAALHREALGPGVLVVVRSIQLTAAAR